MAKKTDELFAENKNYSELKWKPGVPVMDTHLNYAQRASKNTIRRAVCDFLGNGAPLDGFKLTGSVANPTIKAGDIWVAGLKIELASDIAASSQPTPDITFPSGPGLWYLDVCEDEVEGATEHIAALPAGIDPVNFYETKWTLRKLEGTFSVSTITGSSLGTPGSNHFYIGIAIQDAGGTLTDIRNNNIVAAGSDTGFESRVGIGNKTKGAHRHNDEDIDVTYNGSPSSLESVITALDSRVDSIEAGAGQVSHHASSHSAGGADALTVSNLAGTITASQHGNLSTDASYRHQDSQIALSSGNVGSKTTLTEHVQDSSIHAAHNSTFNNSLAITGAVGGDTTLGAHVANASIHGGGSGAGNWKEPVNSASDLPSTATDKDIRYVESDGALYGWDDSVTDTGAPYYKWVKLLNVSDTWHTAQHTATNNAALAIPEDVGENITLGAHLLDSSIHGGGSSVVPTMSDLVGESSTTRHSLGTMDETQNVLLAYNESSETHNTGIFSLNFLHISAHSASLAEAHPIYGAYVDITAIDGTSNKNVVVGGYFRGGATNNDGRTGIGIVTRGSGFSSGGGCDILVSQQSTANFSNLHVASDTQPLKITTGATANQAGKNAGRVNPSVKSASDAAKKLSVDGYTISDMMGQGNYLQRCSEEFSDIPALMCDVNKDGSIDDTEMEYMSYAFFTAAPHVLGTVEASSFTLTDSANILALTYNGTPYTVTLAAGDYTPAELCNAINSRLPFRIAFQPRYKSSGVVCNYNKIILIGRENFTLAADAESTINAVLGLAAGTYSFAGTEARDAWNTDLGYDSFGNRIFAGDCDFNRDGMINMTDVGFLVDGFNASAGNVSVLHATTSDVITDNDGISIVPHAADFKYSRVDTDAHKWIVRNVHFTINLCYDMAPGASREITTDLMPDDMKVHYFMGGIVSVGAYSIVALQTNCYGYSIKFTNNTTNTIPSGQVITFDIAVMCDAYFTNRS